MQRRKFSREFKLEAVRLVKDRGVAVAQAARDLDPHENVLRKWVKEFAADPGQAFPGHGQMKPEQLEIERRQRQFDSEVKKKADAENQAADKKKQQQAAADAKAAEQRRQEDLKRMMGQAGASGGGAVLGHQLRRAERREVVRADRHVRRRVQRRRRSRRCCKAGRCRPAARTFAWYAMARSTRGRCNR